jgi:hypothetical protein
MATPAHRQNRSGMRSRKAPTPRMATPQGSLPPIAQFEHTCTAILKSAWLRPATRWSRPTQGGAGAPPARWWSR